MVFLYSEKEAKLIKKEELWNTEEIKKQGKAPFAYDLDSTYLLEKFTRKNCKTWRKEQRIESKNIKQISW